MKTSHETGFKKDTKDKIRYTLLPPNALEEAVKVFEYGANKYEEGNYLKCTEERVYLDAALRHIYRVLQEEDIDPESSLSHLSHAASNLLMASEISIRNSRGV
jgi:hypothetical protein